MIIWEIESNDLEFMIEVGQVTILKGSNDTWYKLVRCIDDHFNNKTSGVKIYEDTQVLQKKDWECLFIPFDASLQLDKINSKSPLKFLLEDLCGELMLSPTYVTLGEVWEELKDELEIINKKVENLGISLQLYSFEIENLKSFLYFNAQQDWMTPIEYKNLLLKLFIERKMEKKRLIIIELPELYSNYSEYSESIKLINNISKNGTRFIIVTDRTNLIGNVNYYYDGKIINESLIEGIKPKVLAEVPFFCEEKIYNHAKQYLIQSVDNSVNKSGKIVINSKLDEAVATVLFVMLHQLNIPSSLDITGFSLNIRNFIKSYF